MTRRTRIASALVAVLALAACSDSPTAPAERAPAAPALAKGGPKAGGTTTSTSVTACDGTSISLSADEFRTLQLHNQERTANALPTLCVHPALTAAARAHSKEMISKGYFSHDSFDGEPFYLRLERYGYTGGSKGENIGWGSGYNGTPDQMFSMWTWSSGHYANIVNPYFREIGIGVATGRYQGYDNVRMYTVDFGAP